jgi:pilus assembly protein CpaE
VRINVCVHNLDELKLITLPDVQVLEYTQARQALLTCVQVRSPEAVILDLDSPDAVTVIASVLELNPSTAIIGVTGQNDLNLVIAAQRAGCGQIATRPLDPNDLAVALRQALNRTDEAQEGRTFAVLGSSGGAGATTVACHLAHEFTQRGDAQCLLIDLDLEFGGAARALDVTPPFTIYDLSSVGAVDNKLLDKSTVAVPGGPHVLSRPHTIQEAHQIDDHALRNILRAAKWHFPYLVLDLPRRLDPISGCAIELCDKLLVVAQLNVPSIDNARRMIEVLTAEGVPTERIELVLNRHRKHVHNLTPEEVEKQLNRKLLGIIPSDYAAVNRALDTGKALDKRNPVRVAISQIMARLVGESSGGAHGSGWLGRFSASKK